MKKWLSFVTYPKDATNTVAPWQLLEAGGYKEMSSIWAPRFPNAGGGSCGASANENSCTHHLTWSPNKLWRSNSIFNLLLEEATLFWCRLIWLRPMFLRQLDPEAWYTSDTEKKSGGGGLEPNKTTAKMWSLLIYSLINVSLWFSSLSTTVTKRVLLPPKLTSLVLSCCILHITFLYLRQEF